MGVENRKNGEKGVNGEIKKVGKGDVEREVFRELEEELEVLGWVGIVLVGGEVMIVKGKNGVLKNVKVFK